MAVDLAQLAVSIDSRGAKTGADVATQSADKVEASFVRMQSTISRTGTVMTNVEKNFARFGTTASGIFFPGGPIPQAGSLLDKLGVSGAKAGQTFDKFTGILSKAGLAAAGLNGPLGKVGQLLLGLGTGGLGGLAIGAASGLVLYLNNMKKEAEEAKKPLQDLIDKANELNEARRKESGTSLREEYANANQAAIEQQAIVDRLKERLESLPPLVRAMKIGMKDLTKEIGEAESKALTLARTAESFRKAVEEDDEKRKRLAEEAARKAAAEAKARRAQLLQIKDLEDEVAQIRAQHFGATLTAQQIADRRERDAFVEKVKNLDKLSKTEKDRLILLYDQRKALNDQVAAAKELAEVVKQIADLPEIKAITASLNEQTATRDARFQRGGAAVGGVIGLDGKPIQQPGFDELARQREEEQNAIKNTKKTLAEETLQRYKTIDAIGNSAKALVNLTGVLFGISPAARSAITSLIDVGEAIAKGDVGGIITGGISAISSIGSALFGGGPSPEEILQAEANLREGIDALKEFGTEVDAFSQSLRGAGRTLADYTRDVLEAQGFSAIGIRTLEDVERTIANLQRRIREGQRADEARAALADILKLQAEYEEAAKRLRAQAEADLARAKQDFEVRKLLAEGRDEEARALQNQIDLEREIAGLKEQYGELLDAETEAEFRRIILLEQEKRAIEEVNRVAAQRADILADLEAREAALAGDARGASEIGIRSNAARQTRQADDLLASGIIDSATYDRLIAVITGEMLDAIADLTDQYEAQAAAAAKLKAEFEEDLKVRELRATGREKEADALLRETEKRRQIEAALEKGIDEAGIAELKRVQILEDLAAAEREAAEAAEKHLQLLKRESELRDELKVRMLRAQGADDAADALAQLLADAAEIATLRAEGVSEDLISEVLATQKAERDRRAQEREAAFAAAIGEPISTATAASSNAGVSLAQGTSEQTSNRMVGLLSSITTHTSYLEVIAGHIAVMRRIAEASARLTNLDVDRILGVAMDDADRQQGKNPSNVVSV